MDIYNEKKKSVRKEPRSRIAHNIRKLNNKIYRMAGSGVVGTYMTGYDELNRKTSNSFIMVKIREIYSGIRKRYVKKPRRIVVPSDDAEIVIHDVDSLPMSLSNRISVQVDNSLIVKLIRKGVNALLHTQVVTYGVLLFSFALFMLVGQGLTLLLQLYNISLPIIGIFMNADTILTVTYLIIGLILLLLALILLFAGDTSFLCVLFKSKITGKFMRSVMGYKDTKFSDTIPTHRWNAAAFIVGMALGLLTFFLSPFDMLIALFTIISVMVVFKTPECGVVILLFILPFTTLISHPTILTFMICLVIMFSTLTKVMMGKRTLKFTIIDFVILIFMLITLFGGLASTGGSESFQSAAVYFVLGMMYFVITALMKSWTWIKKCLVAIISSSLIVSLIGILEWLFGNPLDIWQDKIAFANITGRAVSLWENPNILAEYLLIAIFAIIAYTTVSGYVSNKLFLMSALAASIVCLVFTWSRGAWIGFIVAILIYFVIKTPKSLPVIGLLILISPIAFAFIPDAIIGRLTSVLTLSDSSVIYRLNIWRGVSDMVADYAFTGIGVGSAAFGAVYPRYSLSGIEGATHSHDLFLQILVETGIVGLAVFVIFIILLARACFTLFKKYTMKSDACRLILALECGIIALLVDGITDYIWYNYRIYLLFWIVVGLIISIRRRQMEETAVMADEKDACDIDVMIVPSER